MAPTTTGATSDTADAGHATLWDAAPVNAPALPDDAPRTIIRDSLYDTIPLGALELDLIGTPEFVRLQGIKQLGFCYRVWPGATHTRFEHSLGVYYLMLRGLRALWAQDYARDRLRASAADLRTMLAAALLHDIGHYPFSHAIEELGYPIEPHDYDFLSKQLRRWSHGFVQNVGVHWRGLLDVPYLRSAVAVSLWDATLAAAVYLLLLPVLAIAFRNPWLLLGYVIDAPAVAVPVLVGAAKRGEVGKALASLPAFLVLRTVNALFFLRAAWSEWVMRRSFHTYEKGH